MYEEREETPDCCVCDVCRLLFDEEGSLDGLCEFRRGVVPLSDEENETREFENDNNYVQCWSEMHAKIRRPSGPKRVRSCAKVLW